MNGEKMLYDQARGNGAIAGQLAGEGRAMRDLGEALTPITKEPGVAMELKQLHASLENLGQRVEHLFSRMEGTLRPVPPSNPSESGKSLESPMSPVAREIVIARNQVSRILGTINEIHGRYDA